MTDELLEICEKLFIEHGQHLENIENCPQDIFSNIDKAFFDRTGISIDELFSMIVKERNISLPEPPGSEQDFQDWVSVYNHLDAGLRHLNLDYRYSFHDDFHGERVLAIDSQNLIIAEAIQKLVCQENFKIRNFQIAILLVTPEGDLTGDQKVICV